MTIIGIFLWIIVAFIIGSVIGISGAIFTVNMQNKRLVKDGIKFLNGQRENKITIEGKVYDVRRFKIPSEKEGVVNIIDVKGGLSVEDGKEGSIKIEKYEDKKETGTPKKSTFGHSIFRKR